MPPSGALKFAARKCVAHKRNGDPCGQWAINGTTVCKMHGGHTKQVIERARFRLLALVNPSIAIMEKALKMDQRNRGLRIKRLEARIKDLENIRSERKKAWQEAQLAWEHYHADAEANANQDADATGWALAEPPMKPPPGYEGGDLVMREREVGKKIVQEFFLDRSVLEELRKHDERLREELTD